MQQVFSIEDSGSYSTALFRNLSCLPWHPAGRNHRVSHSYSGTMLIFLSQRCYFDLGILLPLWHPQPHSPSLYLSCQFSAGSCRQWLTITCVSTYCLAKCSCMQCSWCDASSLSVLIQDKWGRTPVWYNLNQWGSSYEKRSYYSIQSSAFPHLDPSLCTRAHSELLGSSLTVLQPGCAGRRAASLCTGASGTAVALCAALDHHGEWAMGAHRTIWTPLEGTVNSFWFSGNINDKLSTPAIGFYQLILVTFSKLCSKEKGQEI